jgi:hypothetical protein
MNDELLSKNKIYSAGKAYYYSLYIWISLLAFQKFFEKDDILIIGLIGMAISLFISMLLTKRNSGSN